MQGSFKLKGGGNVNESGQLRKQQRSQEGLSEASVLLRDQSQVVCGETIIELQEAGLSR